ncbi:hypothetical protein [Larkinella knui]|uniref:Uncharacterized protein n=1 Tax=Larkinella knui TaxID=2025310 RepID=A0A3P1CUJ8_9BACT|nr:hypothetical protein [Larkinella knui]RRB17003.1 hypothetical protein EHT87_01590 [Larkinella knui]
MVAMLYGLLMSITMSTDTSRIPADTSQIGVMPNAKPSFQSKMPVHKPDENQVIPMPNSGARLRSFQIPREKKILPDSGRGKP